MSRSKARKELDMLHGPIWSKLPRFALPVAATAILEQLFNASDLAVVGNFAVSDRTAAVAAVGANSAVIGLLVNLFVGIALGANVVIATAIGRGDRKTVQQAVHTSIVMALGGGVLVQRFGDLIKGVRTNEHRLGKSFTKPTLNATPGDLSLVLPKRHMDNIIEMIYALDKLAPGTANQDTLLYGVEVKFYSARLQLSGELETPLENMFAIGDGAGITRGLAQAGASGVHVARTIAKRESK